MSLVDKDLGFMYLAEQTSPEENVVKGLKTSSRDGVKYAEFETILQTFEVMNRNIRKYYGPNVSQHLQTERIVSLLKSNGWYGEEDHPLQIYENAPLTSERVKTIYMPKRSHKIMNPNIKNNTLYATIQTSSGTDAGRGFYAEIVQGLIPAFSCRSIARMGVVNGETYVLINFLVTYDWVLYQSDRSAQRVGDTKYVSKEENLVKESAHSSLILPGKRSTFTEDAMIPLRDLISLTSDRDDNIKIIMESFDLRKEDIIGFDKGIDHAIIRDEKNVLYVNISESTKNEVNSFLASF